MTTALEPAALVAIFFAGFVASGINSVAGGGSLISFPLLVGCGIPELPANATNAVALWPGSLTGAFGFIKRIGRTQRYLRDLLLPTAVGSAIGAMLLVSTPAAAFRIAVPALILLATLLLAFQARIRDWSARHRRQISIPMGAALQFLVSVYGGYFGAGMGILMLAVFGLFMEGDIHELNAIKNWLGLQINLVASVMFVVQGLVVPAAAIAMIIGSLIGGYAAAIWSQRVDAEKLRSGIVVLGFLMTSYFIWRLLA
ncbi:MAG: putative membrane transporter protein YfcA [Fimbriimonadaceae bacterium]|nr:putative membrane transporter protein YfcA [Fimbriimonadaceae bacterium]